MRRRNEEWSQLEITRKPIGVGPESTVKYSVPFGWGAMQVTEYADQMYGFVPLAEGIKRGDGISYDADPAGSGMRTDIYLMSPAELEELSIARRRNTIAAPGLGFYAANFHSDGIEVRLALYQSPEEVRTKFLDGLALYMKQLDEDADIEDMRTLDDIPVTESMEQDISQALVHELCDFTAAAVSDVSAQYIRKQENDHTLRGITRLGAVGLGCAGVMIGVSGAATGEVDAITAGAVIAYPGLSFFYARNILKRRYSLASVFEHRLAASSRALGQIVGADIHDTYCTDHFDSMTESMLREE